MKTIPALRHRVVKIIADYYGYDLERLFGKRRDASLAHARQTAYWFLHCYVHMGFSEIGRFVGRDHSTIIHGVERIWKDYDRIPLALISRIKAIVPDPATIEEEVREALRTVDRQKRYQCTLCHATGELKIVKELRHWQIFCGSCGGVIILPNSLTSYDIWQIFAYRVPERGKEYEDYNYN